MEITQDDKENTILCKDDGDDWCTVKKKRQSKRRARFKKKMESVLEAIIEDVSEEELYFSTSSEEEARQRPVQQLKNIELVLKPQQYYNIRNEALNNALSNHNKLIVRNPPVALTQSHPTQCSILDKLHQTLDKVSADSAESVMFHDNYVLCDETF